jgi:hypothetical protein
MAWWIKGLAWLLAGVLLTLATIFSWRANVSLFWPFLCVIFAGVSFSRSYKAFIEVWRSRLSEMVEVQVTAEKDTYAPGDVVKASVRVLGKEELEVEEGRVALVCTNRYVYRYSTTDSDGDHVHRTREATDEVEVAGERILEKQTIRPGSYSAHDLTFAVPSTAAPSASGEITNVEWKVRVTLPVRNAPDVFKELPLTVLSTPESYASWTESAPDFDSQGMCEMTFRLPRRSFRVGERIQGTLVVTPRQDFRARSLLVELARVEVVSRDSGNVSETVEASKVVDESPEYHTGSAREYAFAMAVPGTAGPCLETDQTYVAWTLRATLKRRMAFDPALKLLLNVYNGPTTKSEG